MFEWLESLAIAEAVRSSRWGYPLVEATHIAAFASMFGSVLTVEMRVFGLHKRLPALELGRLGVHVALAAFVVIVCSGTLVFVANATELVSNPALQVKLGLITLAVLNMVVFHARGSLVKLDAIARAQAALSLALWLGVICAGRLIAYL